ncbi:MAG: Pepco domain-containing protein [Spirulinaceae cyanobacterium]
MVTVADAETVGGSKSIDGYAPMYGEADDSSTPPNSQRTPVDTAELKRQMSGFVGTVEDVFDEAEQKSRKIQLDEIELTVAVNAKGEVSLWGLGSTEVGGSAALKLKFSRKDG